MTPPRPRRIPNQDDALRKLISGFIDEETRARVYELGMQAAGSTPPRRSGQWGARDFEAHYKEVLDNSGFRTGFQYLEPLSKKEAARHIGDVELPPHRLHPYLPPRTRSS